MYGAAPPLAERLRAASLTALLVAAIGWALVTGLRIGQPREAAGALATFDVVVPPPPPVRVVPERTRSRRPEGRAAPAGLRSRASAIVAPPVPAIVPPPIPPAPVAGTGVAPTQGAAARPGPGPGAGGIGDGRGSGGDGDGDGDGTGYEQRPRWLSGRLRYRDGGDQFGEAVIGRSVSLRCTLETSGRVRDCVAARPSGLAGLDALIARLAEERFRYRPWIDDRGRAVTSTILIDQQWDEER